MKQYFSTCVLIVVFISYSCATSASDQSSEYDDLIDFKRTYDNNREFWIRLARTLRRTGNMRGAMTEIDDLTETRKRSGDIDDDNDQSPRSRPWARLKMATMMRGQPKPMFLAPYAFWRTARRYGRFVKRWPTARLG